MCHAVCSVQGVKQWLAYSSQLEFRKVIIAHNQVKEVWVPDSHGLALQTWSPHSDFKYFIKKSLCKWSDPQCWMSTELLGNYSHCSLSWGVEVKYELRLLYCPSNSSSQTRSLLLLVTPTFMQGWSGLNTRPAALRRPGSALPICRAALWSLHYYTMQCTASCVFLKVHHSP